MDTLRLALYILHMLAMLAIVAGAFVPARTGHLVQVWGARVQLLVGLALVAVIEMGDLGELNHLKIGVKLLLALAVVATAEIGNGRNRRGGDGQTLALICDFLTVVNAVVAFTWH